MLFSCETRFSSPVMVFGAALDLVAFSFRGGVWRLCGGFACLVTIFYSFVRILSFPLLLVSFGFRADV